MIEPMHVDLVLRQNDNPFRVVVSLKENGVPINMTGWDGRVEFRLNPGDTGAPILRALVGSLGSSITLNATGFELVIDNASAQVVFATVGLPSAAKAGAEGRLAWEALLRPPGGDENVWIEGDVVLKQRVTSHA